MIFPFSSEKEKMSKTIHKILQKVIFNIVSKPHDARMSTEEKSIIEAEDFEEFIVGCESYMRGWMQGSQECLKDLKKLHHTDRVLTPEEEELLSDYESELLQPFLDMFPILSCLHADDLEEIKETILKDLLKEI